MNRSLIVVFLILSLLVGYRASILGRSFFRWMIFSMIFSMILTPILGWLAPFLVWLELEMAGKTSERRKEEKRFDSEK